MGGNGLPTRCGTQGFIVLAGVGAILCRDFRCDHRLDGRSAFGGPSGVWCISATVGGDEYRLAGIKILALGNAPAAVEVVPNPGAFAGLESGHSCGGGLLAAEPVACGQERHRTQCIAGGADVCVWLARVLCDQLPENLQVTLVAAADEARDIDIGTGQIGRSIEQLVKLVAQ